MQVDGICYGTPETPFVVVWSGPVDATSFPDGQAARREIERQLILQNPDAFQARLYTYAEETEQWILA